MKGFNFSCFINVRDRFWVCKRNINYKWMAGQCKLNLWWYQHWIIQSHWLKMFEYFTYHQDQVWLFKWHFDLYHPRPPVKGNNIHQQADLSLLKFPIPMIPSIQLTLYQNQGTVLKVHSDKVSFKSSYLNSQGL